MVPEDCLIWFFASGFVLLFGKWRQFTISNHYQGRSSAMLKSVCIAILAVVLILSFSSVTYAQGEMKQETVKKDEMKKEEMKKGDMEKEMAMGPLKSVTCDPACGFMVRSHSEKELISMVKMHAKKVHNKTVTDKEIRAMMKTEEAAAPK